MHTNTPHDEEATPAPQQPRAPQELATPAPHAAQDDAVQASHATLATHDAALPTPATNASSQSVAADAALMSAPIGEKRTLAEVLIENAKLIATIDGRDHVIRSKEETIAELKDDRAFLRDEVRESREQRKDVKDIASRMLEAMQTIAIAGKLPPTSPQNENITARVIDSDDQRSSPHN